MRKGKGEKVKTAKDEEVNGQGRSTKYIFPPYQS